MRPDRQRFLHRRATPRAVLCCEARVPSDHLPTSTCSLVGQDTKQRAPSSTQNALCQFTPCQSANVQILDSDQLVHIRVLLCRREMNSAALAFDVPVGLRHVVASDRLYPARLAACPAWGTIPLSPRWGSVSYRSASLAGLAHDLPGQATDPQPARSGRHRLAA